MNIVTVTNHPSCLVVRPFLGSLGGTGRRWLCVLARSGRDQVGEHEVEVTGWLCHPSYRSFVRQGLHCGVVFLSEDSEV